jgi:hypothetical protein
MLERNSHGGLWGSANGAVERDLLQIRSDGDERPVLWGVGLRSDAEEGMTLGDAARIVTDGHIVDVVFETPHFRRNFRAEFETPAREVNFQQHRCTESFVSRGFVRQPGAIQEVRGRGQNPIGDPISSAHSNGFTEKTGTVDHIGLAGDNRLVMARSRVTLSPAACDTENSAGLCYQLLSALEVTLLNGSLRETYALTLKPGRGRMVDAKPCVLRAFG